MNLINLPSLLIVGVALLAAAIAGRFGKGSLNVARGLILPAGLVGTLIGFVQMLQNMDDPLMIGPACSVALLTSLYAAICKVALDVGWNKEPNPESPEHYGIIGAVLWAAVIVAAMFMGSSIFDFINIPALVLIGVALVIIGGVAKIVGHPDIIALLTHYLPGFGALILFASIVDLLPNLVDPTTIGPIMAWGLLGALYCNLVAMLLQLTFPHRKLEQSLVSQWLVFGASLLGVATQMALVVLAL